MYRCTHKYVAIALALSVSSFLPTAVQAAEQNYPTRPVTVVVPFPPGGTADGFTRLLSDELSKRLDQPVVVQNRAGANGNIGSAFAANQPADGYTILYGSASTLVVNSYIYPDTGFNAANDMVPLTITHQMPNVLVVGSDTPYHDVASLIEDAKANPGKLAYASAGTGNSMHLAAEQFKEAAGVDMLHIPYKGGADAINDILGGRVPLMFNNLPAIVELVKSGRLRALAVTDDKRSPLLPDVPTMAEAGVPNFKNVIWVGLVMKQGTDPQIIKRLSGELREILGNPAFTEPTERQGYEIIASTPEEFQAVWSQDVRTFGELTERIGIRVN